MILGRRSAISTETLLHNNPVVLEAVPSSREFYRVKLVDTGETIGRTTILHPDLHTKELYEPTITNTNYLDRGLGLALYVAASTVGDQVLHSNSDPTLISESARRVWESLVSRDVAQEIGYGGVYRFLFYNQEGKQVQEAAK